MGRRVKKSVYLYDSGKSPAWQLEKYILFVYDGWNLIREITVASGAESSRYFVWGLDLSRTLQGAGGIGGLLASVDSSGTAYSYLYDANGNVTQVVKSSDGSVAAHYEYDPYGNLTRSYGEYAAGNPFRFSTKYKDDETGLVYYGYRYYDPELGRWINRDPLRENGSVLLRIEKAAREKIDPNLLAFLQNNSVNFVDSLGLAYFAYRPLGGFMKIFSVTGCEIDDPNNTAIAHEQLFFEDGKEPANIGFFNINEGQCSFEKDTAIYRSPHDSGWNDCVMRKAYMNAPLKKIQTFMGAWHRV